MNIPNDRIFKGIIDTINEAILPEISSPYIKSQAIAIGSILNSMIVKNANIHQRLLEQNNSLKNIFQQLTKILSDYKDYFASEELMKLSKEINQQSQKIYEVTQPLADENNALKLLLEKVIEILWEIDEQVRKEVMSWQWIKRKSYFGEKIPRRKV